VCVEHNRAIFYILAQINGGLVGAAILLELHPAPDSTFLCTSVPGDSISVGQLFGYELLITFVLVLTVHATCDAARPELSGSGPLAIGLSVTMCHLWAVSRPCILVEGIK